MYISDDEALLPDHYVPNVLHEIRIGLQVFPDIYPSEFHAVQLSEGCQRF